MIKMDYAPDNMKLVITSVALVLFGFAVSVTAQTSKKECDREAVTIKLDSRDSTTNVALGNFFRSALPKHSKGALLRVDVYAQGSWGTNGLAAAETSVTNFAQSILPKERVFVSAGGYRKEASVDVLLLAPGCKNLLSIWETGPLEMTLEQVDFSDAPLALSVFPSPNELDGLITKRAMGICEFDSCYASVRFFIVVGRDGRVLNSWPEDLKEFRLESAFSEPSKPTLGAIKKFYSAARQALFNWAFKPVVIDGTPRFVRGRVTVTVADEQMIEFLNRKAKSKSHRKP